MAAAQRQIYGQQYGGTGACTHVLQGPLPHPTLPAEPRVGPHTMHTRHGFPVLLGGSAFELLWQHDTRAAWGGLHACFAFVRSGGVLRLQQRLL